MVIRALQPHEIKKALELVHQDVQVTGRFFQ